MVLWDELCVDEEHPMTFKISVQRVNSCVGVQNFWRCNEYSENKLINLKYPRWLTQKTNSLSSNCYKVGKRPLDNRFWVGNKNVPWKINRK